MVGGTFSGLPGVSERRWKRERVGGGGVNIGWRDVFRAARGE